MKRAQWIPSALMLLMAAVVPLQASPAPPKASFHVEPRKDLLGKLYHVVVLVYQGLPDSPVVDVHSAAGGLSTQQRAQKMAERMNLLQKKDPNWATKTLVRRTKDGQWVVAVNGDGKVPWVATADPKSVRAMNALDPHDLASKIKDKIEQRVRPKINFIVPPGKFRAEAVPVLPRYSAADWLSDGDTCRSNGTLTEAIKDYRQALKLSPDYVQAMLALAVIYADMPGKQREARNMLANVSKHKDLDADQKQVLQVLKEKLQP